MNKEEYDIVLLGGGISNSLLSISILRKHPSLKLLILEKDQAFGQKVGESTSDITALFLRRFDIDEIMESHVQKTGLRFLFNEARSEELDDVSEFSSPTFDGPNNGFQLNRKTFDEQLLQKAKSLGAKVYRPCKLEAANFNSLDTKLKVNYQGVEININCKWFVDGSGRSRYIHNTLKWKDLPTQLKTAAIYAHFSNVKPAEQWKLSPNKFWDENAVGDSALSTLHFMRDNAWWWYIKIDEHTCSIGYVYNKEAHDLINPIEFFEKEITQDPQIKSIVEDSTHSTPVTVDNIAYQSEQLYSQGIALVGDSGAFVDPMVSPGIELICQQVLWLSDLIPKSLTEENFPDRKWKKYNRLFTRAYRDRMEIYRNGYRYMNSYDLSSNWLQLGLLAYFGIHVFLAFLFPRRLKVPFTIHPLGRPGFKYMLWRLNRIDKRRRQQGRNSNHKAGEVTYSSFYYPTGIFFYTIPARMFFKWLGRYIKLEAKEFKYIFKRK